MELKMPIGILIKIKKEKVYPNEEGLLYSEN